MFRFPRKSAKKSAAKALKPIKLYWHSDAPNPSKVLVILEELEVPYVTSFVEPGGLRAKPYTDVNPYGRVPAIEDPNTSATLWESGAVVEYLIETYDKDHRISFAAGSPEVHLARQWSYFQASSQDPYFREATWVNLFHKSVYGEEVKSIKERFNCEAERVVLILDTVLAGRHWLVGGRCSYADLAFTMWNVYIGDIMASLEGKHVWDPDAYPNFKRWQDACMARESVKRVLSVRAQEEVVCRLLKK